jgi:hypothetical protein
MTRTPSRPSASRFCRSSIKYSRPTGDDASDEQVKPGQYVGIIYDQKALGIRHADKIYLMNDANQRLGRQ